MQVYEELRGALEATEAALAELHTVSILHPSEHGTAQENATNPSKLSDLTESEAHNPQNGTTIGPEGHAATTRPRDTAPLPSTTGTAPAAPRTTNSTIPNNNNLRIHPRSLYSSAEPDFAALAQQYPALEQYLVPLKPSQTHAFKQNSKKSTKNDALFSSSPPLLRQSIDFTNPAACRELTRTLLKSDFGINWDLPDGHLVPPVTNRLNYILWLEDLLTLSKPHGAIRGLDIGCGASLIYPLLGASVCGWEFIGIDVTPQAIEWAQRNLAANPQLRELIEVRHVEMQPEQATFFNEEERIGEEEQEDASIQYEGLDNIGKHIINGAVSGGINISSDPKHAGNGVHGGTDRATYMGRGIISSGVLQSETFAFTMCNPPFFHHMSQAGANPGTAFGGTKEESVYPGGEESFVRNMVEDSKLLRNHVYWFSTMVGKKVTLKAVRKWLHSDPSMRVVRTTEFFQGQTSRWGIAWSFIADPEAASKPLQRGSSATVALGTRRDRTDEEESVGGAGASEMQRPAKKKVVGRSVSLQLRVNNSNAAVSILKSIEMCLIKRKLRCNFDVGLFQINAEVADECSVGACPLRIQLLAQQPKLYILTVAIDKGAPLSPAVMGWFSSVIDAVEAIAIQHGRLIN